MIRLLENLSRVLGGRGHGMVRLRDTLTLLQAAIAVLCVTLAHSASYWAVGVAVLLSAWAMVRPLPEASTTLSQRLWTVGIVAALILSGVRAFYSNELLIAGVDFFLLLIVQRLFNRQKTREHMQLLMIGAMLMVIAAVVDAELRYPFLLALYLPVATLGLLVVHLLSEGERLGKRVAFEVDRYASRQLERLNRAALQVALIAAGFGVATFLFFPRFGAGVFLRGNVLSQESVGFSESVALGGFGTIKSDATVVMHLQTLDEGGVQAHGSRPTWHLRGSAFDQYQNGRWGRSTGAQKRDLRPTRGYYVTGDATGNDAEVIAWPYRHSGSTGQTLDPRPIPGYAAHDELLRVMVTMEDIGTDLLFAAGQPLAYSVTPRSQLDSRNKLGADVDGQARVLDRRSGPIQYEFVSRVGEPTRAELQAVGAPEVPEHLDAYLQLDPHLSEGLRELAEEVTAGADTRVEKVEAVEQYLLQNYEYTLDQPLSERVRDGELDPIEGFLFDTKAGHCEYFASAMALMLREVGVPTRNVNGFYGAHYNPIGEFYVVRQADAHSWVEVYFEDLGWVTFDPTPPAGRTAGDDAPLFPRLSEVGDALRDAYLEYVIDYDLETQLEVLENFGVKREGRKLELDWQRFTPWLIGAGSIVFIVLLGRRLLGRGRQVEAPEVLIYRKLLTTMQKRERGRHEHESARAWAKRLRDEGAPAAEVEALNRFATAYELLRFGPRDAEGRVEPARIVELERLAKAVRESPSE